jgi:hypothetical protein
MAFDASSSRIAGKWPAANLGLVHLRVAEAPLDPRAAGLDQRAGERV